MLLSAGRWPCCTAPAAPAALHSRRAGPSGPPPSAPRLACTASLASGGGAAVRRALAVLGRAGLGPLAAAALAPPTDFVLEATEEQPAPKVLRFRTLFLSDIHLVRRRPAASSALRCRATVGALYIPWALARKLRPLGARKSRTAPIHNRSCSRRAECAAPGHSERGYSLALLLGSPCE